MRETTLAPHAFLNKAGYPLRKTQDEATLVWNLATGLYYKTRAKPPWRLGSVRPGVCYIGMVYKSLSDDPNGHACCAAQMFLNEGDGVVFRGANGPWRTGDDDYHLKKDAAKSLLKLVLATYKEMHGEPPKELFIHGQTYFNDEEWQAFCEAAPAGRMSWGCGFARPAARPSSSVTVTTLCCAALRYCWTTRSPISGPPDTCRSSTPKSARRRRTRCI